MVRPHYAARQNGIKCDLAARQMARIMWTSMQRGLGRASSCHGIKNRPAKCRSHQRFAAQHMISKRFQNYISQLEKKIRQSLLVSFHSFCNLCKRFFFMWTRSNWRHMPSNFCCAAKLQCVAFCHTAQCGCTFREIVTLSLKEIEYFFSLEKSKVFSLHW